MRTILALVALCCACSASGPSGPVTGGDAAADAPAADAAFPCVRGAEVYIGGQCVPFGDSNCGAAGRACPSSQVCTIGDAPDGDAGVLCAPRQ